MSSMTFPIAVYPVSLVLVSPDDYRSCFFDHNTCIWEFGFRLQSCNIDRPSKINFSDREGHITRALLSDILMFSEIQEIREFYIRSIRISWAYSSGDREPMHKIIISGHGYHSKFQDETSDFSFSFFSTSSINSYMDELVKLIHALE